MVKTKEVSRMNLFFMESVVVLFCTSLVSIVIGTGFLKADAVNKKSLKRVQAMTEATAIAEHIRGGKEVAPIPEVWYYDANWEVTDQTNNTFVATLTKEVVHYPQGELYYFTIEIQDDVYQVPLYTLTFSHYIHIAKEGDA